LNSLPENERKADLFGDWETFASTFFPDFTRKYNIIPPFQIPAWFGTDPSPHKFPRRATSRGSQLGRIRFGEDGIPRKKRNVVP
jgi:hypothetical protein